MIALTQIWLLRYGLEPPTDRPLVPKIANRPVMLRAMPGALALFLLPSLTQYALSGRGARRTEQTRAI